MKSVNSQRVAPVLCGGTFDFVEDVLFVHQGPRTSWRYNEPLARNRSGVSRPEGLPKSRLRMPATHHATRQ